MATNKYYDYSEYALIGDSNSKMIPFKPLQRDVGQYVSEWFEKNGDDKPMITLFRPRDITIETIANAFFSPKEGNLVPIDHVNWMIYSVVEKWSETVETSWTSFGRRLCTADNAVSINTMFKIVIKEADQDPPAWYTDLPNVGDPIGALYYIFAPLRLTSKYQEYNAAVAKKMKEVIDSNARHRPMQHTLVATKYSSWGSNLTYKKLAAAIDMFLDRFPNHPHARLRMGTIVTRFKDSSLISSVPFFYNNMGVPGEILAAWVWNRQAAVQLNRLLHPKNCLDEEYGYNAYGCALELVGRSINSITQNPELHLFIHTVCALQGKERSKNAYFPENADTLTVVKSALLVAGLKILAPSGDIQYARGGKLDVPVSDDEEDDTLSEVSIKHKPVEEQIQLIMKKSPTLFDPQAWSSFLNAHKEIPIRDYTICKSARGTLDWTNLRDGTVGKRVQDISKVLLEAYSGKFH